MPINKKEKFFIKDEQDAEYPEIKYRNMKFPSNKKKWERRRPNLRRTRLERRIRFNIRF